MKALTSVRPGGPETLRIVDTPEPTPREGEVKVAVKACGVNFPDTLLIEDRYQYKPERPFSPGGEVAGVIEAVGPGVEGFEIGTRVAACTGWGGMAEKLVVPVTRCFRIPPQMPFVEAAGLLITYGTALYALRGRGRLQAGETLLVLGAAGGLGLAAVELGTALGARVVAAVSSEAKAAATRRSGAADTVIYPSAPQADSAQVLAGMFKAVCGPEGANIVFDCVGGPYSEAALRAIAWRGRFLVVGFPSGIAKIPLNLVLLKGCDLAGVFWNAHVDREPQAHFANIAEVFALYERGVVRPHISQVLPIERGGEAIAALSGRQAIGKIVVSL